MKGASIAQVRREARRLFQSGLVHDPLVLHDGRLQDPKPVKGPDGSTVGWFIPVVVSERLVGFLQLDSRLSLLRWSTFPHRAGSIDDCPSAESWLDPKVILHRARLVAPAGTSLGEPYLTFDRHLTRLVWAVHAQKPGGGTHTVYVVGEHSYLADKGPEETT